MTRSSDSGMPIRSAIAVRIRCGVWVEQVKKMRPEAGSYAAWPPRASSGMAFCRRERISTEMSRYAAFRAALKSGVACRASTMTLPGTPL